jgi:hypothetical protein
MIRTDPPNPLFKGEIRLDEGREDRLLAETMIKAGYIHAQTVSFVKQYDFQLLEIYDFC